MKLISIMLIFTLYSFISCKKQPEEKKDDIPEIVKTRFATMHPNAGPTTWEKEGLTYEASYKEKNSEVTLVFTADGTLERTETETSLDSLPDRLKDYVVKNMDGKKIEEATKIVDGFGNITWEAKIGDIDYLFATNGVLIGQEPPETGDEEKD